MELTASMVMTGQIGKGVELIAKERNRQCTRKSEGGEGWDHAHDAQHTDESIACAAAVYAMPERFRKKRKRGLWRWAPKWFKPTPDDRVRELVKAGALIAAEIDRVYREPNLAAGTRDDFSGFGR